MSLFDFLKRKDNGHDKEKQKHHDINITVEFATEEDAIQISQLDAHIAKNELESLIMQKRVLSAKQDGKLYGFLRFNLFWDNTPFINMLFVIEKHRKKGIGARLIQAFEAKVKEQGYTKVLTSSLSSEEVQHFYRKLGYFDCGSLLLPNEPLEIFFVKEI